MHRLSCIRLSTAQPSTLIVWYRISCSCLNRRDRKTRRMSGMISLIGSIKDMTTIMDNKTMMESTMMRKMVSKGEAMKDISTRIPIPTLTRSTAWQWTHSTCLNSSMNYTNLNKIRRRKAHSVFLSKELKKRSQRKNNNNSKTMKAG